MVNSNYKWNYVLYSYLNIWCFIFYPILQKDQTGVTALVQECISLLLESKPENPFKFLNEQYVNCFYKFFTFYMFSFHTEKVPFSYFNFLSFLISKKKKKYVL